MKASHLLLGAGLLVAGTVHAQIDLPLSDVSLAYPSLPPITVRLGSTDRYILPTPFVLGGGYTQSALWFCMDPLQTIFYRGSGEPPGSALHYASDDPANYDRWNSHAPGLTAARLQDLADLFTAYAPTRSNALIGGALQLAVPEITNEFDGYPFSLSSGKFRAYGSGTAAHSVISLAQEMLASLTDPSIKNHGDVRSLRFLIDGSYTHRHDCPVPVQDLVGFVPVPEPSTYAATAAGVLGLLIAWRVRRRHQRSAGQPDTI